MEILEESKISYLSRQKNELLLQRERLEYLQSLIARRNSGKRMTKKQQQEIERIKIKMCKLDILDKNGNVTDFYRKER